MFGDGSWVAYVALLLPLAWLGIPAAVLLLVFRFVRAYERRGRSTAAEVGLVERVAFLEEQVARLEAEQARFAEGQRFTNALLAQREPAAPHRDRAAT